MGCELFMMKKKIQTGSRALDPSESIVHHAGRGVNTQS